MLGFYSYLADTVILMRLSANDAQKRASGHWLFTNLSAAGLHAVQALRWHA